MVINTMGQILGAMVTPAMMYAGLGAAGVPILIHLLSKRRFRKVRWAAIDFLREAQRRNRRRVQIEELILLGLRCLAMFLIGLMLARWFVRPEALAAVLGGTARTDRFVVIDDSFSMDLDTGDQKVFDRARRATRQLVEWIRDESPDDALTILRTSRPDHPVLNEPDVGRMEFGVFEALLDGISPSHHAGRMAATVESIRRILDGRSETVNVAVHVISDYQRYEWVEGGAPATLGGAEPTQERHSPVTPLVDWPGEDRSLRLVLIDVGADRTANLAITSIEPEQPQVVRSVSAGYRVKVTNFGRVETQPTTMNVFVGDAALPAVAVPAIPARQSAEVAVEINFPREGPEMLSFELDGDALPTDDRRYRAEPVAQAMRVLIVNGEPAADPYEDEVYLMTVALRPEGPQFSGNEVTIVDENEFEATELTPFHLVILANAYRVNEDWATRLESYVEKGGGLAVFVGDQIDPELYNRILHAHGRGLLPARLMEVIDAPNEVPGVGIRELEAGHPMLRRFGDVSYFNDVLVWRWFHAQVEDPLVPEPQQPGAITVEEAETQPATDGRGPARVLMSLSDPDEHPLMIERTYGEGKVILVTTTADKEWNNLANHPTYLVLLMEMVQHLARPSGIDTGGTVGRPISFSLDPARYQPSAVVRTPAYPGEAEVRLDAQPDPETGLPMIHWNDSELSGVYRFALTESTGQADEHLVAVNVDTRESDLSRATRVELNAAASGLPFEYVTGDEVMGQGELDARRELWRVILLAVVLTLVAEQTLAWWFGSSRRWNVLWQGGTA